MHAGEQLGEIERLGDVVVGAPLEAADARLELVLCREQQHRRRNAALAQLGDDAETVASRQHPVQQDAAKAALERAFQCAIPRICFGNALSFFAERLAQEATEIAIVLDQKYLHAANLWRARRSM